MFAQWPLILWPNTSIYDPKSFQVPLVNVWLARSANSSLYLKFDYRHEEPDLRAASQIPTSFISRLEYWRTIDFEFPLKLLDAFFPIVQFSKYPSFLNPVSSNLTIPCGTPMTKFWSIHRGNLEGSPHISKLKPNNLGPPWNWEPPQACTIPSIDSRWHGLLFIHRWSSSILRHSPSYRRPLYLNRNILNINNGTRTRCPTTSVAASSLPDYLLAIDFGLFIPFLKYYVPCPSAPQI